MRTALPDVRDRSLVWGALLATTVGLLALALSPPWLPPGMRAVVLSAFSPVCHQIPVRSPMIGEVQIAICDRCTGIYAGLVLGVATVGGGQMVWSRLGRFDRHLLLGSLVPLGIDWIGPVLGLWQNGPVSRALTGLIFGVVAASFVANRLLRERTWKKEAASSTRADEEGFA